MGRLCMELVMLGTRVGQGSAPAPNEDAKEDPAQTHPNARLGLTHEKEGGDTHEQEPCEHDVRQPSAPKA